MIILLVSSTIVSGVMLFSPSKQATKVLLLDEIVSSPNRSMEPADSTQTFSFSIASWDYHIVTSSYSASHLNTRFTYRISFSVTGGSLEFFICLAPEASAWAHYSPIFLDPDDHWGSTTGVTATRTLYSNVALAFVFNNEHNDGRSVSGSIVVDSSGPAVQTSLLHNATYNETLPIIAYATDTFSSVDSMSIYIDSSKKEDNNTGYIHYDWNTYRYSNGNHSISVLAEDTNGHVTNLTYLVWVYNESIPLSINPVGFVGIVAIVAICVYWYGKKNGWRKAKPTYKSDIYIPQ